mmetsp:Transcript_101722/g.287954  ORF Transcript_101722/g.287954 Transcript_101722/m.287954 type:complete len:207 (+) Transcript_101722:1883-2503(+)
MQVFQRAEPLAGLLFLSYQPAPLEDKRDPAHDLPEARRVLVVGPLQRLQVGHEGCGLSLGGVQALALLLVDPGNMVELALLDLHSLLEVSDLLPLLLQYAILLVYARQQRHGLLLQLADVRVCSNLEAFSTPLLSPELTKKPLCFFQLLVQVSHYSILPVHAVPKNLVVLQQLEHDDAQLRLVQGLKLLQLLRRGSIEDPSDSIIT